MSKKHNPHSIHHEPALGNIQGAGDDSDIAAQSVWDEVATQGMNYETPENALSYSNWYAYNAQECSALKSWGVVGLIALAGGPLAIVGVLLGGNGNSSLPWIATVLWAPIMEESLKIMGTIILLERFLYFFRSSLQLFLCIIASALCFAVIENIMYLQVYIEQPSETLITWRWTICTGLHVGASSIAYLGVRAMWLNSRAAFTKPLVKDALPYIIAATCLHGAYNLFAVLFEVTLHPF